MDITKSACPPAVRTKQNYAIVKDRKGQCSASTGTRRSFAGWEKRVFGHSNSNEADDLQSVRVKSRR